MGALGRKAEAERACLSTDMPVFLSRSEAMGATPYMLIYLVHEQQGGACPG